MYAQPAGRFAVAPGNFFPPPHVDSEVIRLDRVQPVGDDGLALTPDEVLDYVVVHELCHRREMNHSPRFWQAVEQILPNYKAWRAWLKAHGRELIAKL